jgi:hypothetical protein
MTVKGRLGSNCEEAVNFGNGSFDAVSGSAVGWSTDLDPSRLGAHSLRVRHVTEALANGADAVKAKEQIRRRRIDPTLGYNRRRTILTDNTSGRLGL